MGIENSTPSRWLFKSSSLLRLLPVHENSAFRVAAGALLPVLTAAFQTFLKGPMSLQGLISGSECAVPLNPLSQVLKHTEGDRSLQQVCQQCRNP